MHRYLATTIQGFALLPLFTLAGAAAASEKGFTTLFDGKSLDGWIGATEVYEAKGGVLASKAGKFGELYTKNTYGDFIFRCEFRLTPGANNGIALRAPGKGDPAYVGIESQVLDNSAKKFQQLKPYQFHGSLYGVAPAKRGALKPLGAWNEQEIRCLGRHVRVKLNGKVIVDVDLDEVAPDGKTIDGKRHPGLTRQSGHLGLLGHNERVEYRKLRVIEVTREQAEAIEAAGATLNPPN